jgi:hypothetical protein
MAAPAPDIICVNASFPEYARRQSHEVMIANASEKFDGQGKLTDEKAHNLIRHLWKLSSH